MIFNDKVETKNDSLTRCNNKATALPHSLLFSTHCRLVRFREFDGKMSDISPDAVWTISCCLYNCCQGRKTTGNDGVRGMGRDSWRRVKRSRKEEDIGVMKKG